MNIGLNKFEYYMLELHCGTLNFTLVWKLNKNSTTSANVVFGSRLIDLDLCMNEMKENIQNHNHRHFAKITEIQ